MPGWARVSGGCSAKPPQMAGVVLRGLSQEGRGAALMYIAGSWRAPCPSAPRRSSIEAGVGPAALGLLGRCAERCPGPVRGSGGASIRWLLHPSAGEPLLWWPLRAEGTWGHFPRAFGCLWEHPGGPSTLWGAAVRAGLPHGQGFALGALIPGHCTRTRPCVPAFPRAAKGSLKAVLCLFPFQNTTAGTQPGRLSGARRQFAPRCTASSALRGARRAPGVVGRHAAQFHPVSPSSTARFRGPSPRAG